MKQKSYESTVMRMAGNIAAGMVGNSGYLEAMKRSSKPGADHCLTLAANAVELARAIVAEVERTEPPSPEVPRP